MTGDNYLELEHHWAAVTDLLFQFDERRAAGLTHANVTVKCADLLFQGNGDVVGSGRMVAHIAHEHDNHFVPLLKQQFSRRLLCHNQS